MTDRKQAAEALMAIFLDPSLKGVEAPAGAVARIAAALATARAEGERRAISIARVYTEQLGGAVSGHGVIKAMEHGLSAALPGVTPEVLAARLAEVLAAAPPSEPSPELECTTCGCWLPNNGNHGCANHETCACPECLAHRYVDPTPLTPGELAQCSKAAEKAGIIDATRPPKAYSVDDMAAFHEGDKVSKVGGDYRFDGVVVSRFAKLGGPVRFVVEDDRGVLHIYSAKNLKRRTP